MNNMKILSWNDSILPKEKWVTCRIVLVVEHEIQKIEIYVPPKVCGREVMYCNTYDENADGVSVCVICNYVCINAHT